MHVANPGDALVQCCWGNASSLRTRDVGDVPVAEAWVECVADSTQAHDAVPGLQVARGVPGKGAHHITKPARESGGGGQEPHHEVGQGQEGRRLTPSCLPRDEAASSMQESV